MLRLLLVEDHATLREPLAFMIEREPDLTVVGQAASVAEAGAMLDGADLAVVDLELPDGSGIDVIHALRRRSRDAQAIVLTGTTDRVLHARAYEAGAALVLPKSTRIADIIAAARRVAAGEQVVPPNELIELLRQLSQWRHDTHRAQAALDSLTPREVEVLRALTQGMSDKQIAAAFSVSDRTVRNHVVSILDKLGVDSRLQAVLLALRAGVVVLE